MHIYIPEDRDTGSISSHIGLQRQSAIIAPVDKAKPLKKQIMHHLKHVSLFDGIFDEEESLIDEADSSVCPQEAMMLSRFSMRRSRLLMRTFLCALPLQRER